MNSTGFEAGVELKNPAALSRVGERIRELRRRRGWNQAELAGKAGIRPGQMNYLEKGRHLPSVRILYRLARVLEAPVDSFFAAESPLYCVTESRPAQVRESEERQEYGGPYMKYSAMVFQDERGRELAGADVLTIEKLIHAFLALEDMCGAQKRANIPLRLSMPRTEAGIEHLVARVRVLMGVSDAVIFDYLELFENAGLRVVFAPIGGETLSLSCYDADSQNAFFFVADGRTVERQIFRLAYELGRIYLHTGGVESLWSASGRARMDAHHVASRFAALFLMPAEAVHSSVRQVGVKPEQWSYELLLRLKHRFGVSAEAFLYRLKELGLIAEKRAKELKAAITAHYEKTGFAEPDSSRRVLTPNGRLGDLLLMASRDKANAGELSGIRGVLKEHGVRMP